MKNQIKDKTNQKIHDAIYNLRDLIDIEDNDKLQEIINLLQQASEKVDEL